VIRADYRDVLAKQSDVAVIYADPPYTRDHYSRFYHVLETLCLRDFPNVSTAFQTGPTSRGVYRTERHQSPFCIKSKAPGAFTELFAGAKGIPMLISYSPFAKNGHPRMMTIEAVTELAKQHYREVKVVQSKLIHSKLNKTDRHLKALDEAEVFLACR
jgi:adenine-specific DNA methylase